MNLKRGLDEMVYDLFIDELYNGVFHAGEKIDPAALTESFQISRTPVIQALKRLASEKILEVSSGGKYFIPDPDTREMLWRTTIPKGTPLGDDVDIRFLAERFEFVGGNIRNCILNAAFLAAADGDGKTVTMKHYLMAIKYEFVKTGKVFTRADFEPYAYMVGLGDQEED